MTTAAIIADAASVLSCAWESKWLILKHGSGTMTVNDLADFAVPYVRTSLKASKPNVVAQVGPAAWVILWPAWHVVVGPLLPFLTRLAIEISIGLTAAKLIPFLEFAKQFSAMI